METIRHLSRICDQYIKKSTSGMRKQFWVTSTFQNISPGHGSTSGLKLKIKTQDV